MVKKSVCRVVRHPCRAARRFFFRFFSFPPLVASAFALRRRRRDRGRGTARVAGSGSRPRGGASSAARASSRRTRRPGERRRIRRAAANAPRRRRRRRRRRQSPKRSPRRPPGRHPCSPRTRGAWRARASRRTAGVERSASALNPGHREGSGASSLENATHARVAAAFTTRSALATYSCVFPGSSAPSRQMPQLARELRGRTLGTRRTADGTPRTRRRRPPRRLRLRSRTYCAARAASASAEHGLALVELRPVPASPARCARASRKPRRPARRRACAARSGPGGWP